MLCYPETHPRSKLEFKIVSNMTKGQTQSHVLKLLEYSIISSAHFSVFHFKSILFLNILIKIGLYHLPSSILLSSSILLPSLKSLKYPHQLSSRWPVFVLDYCSVFKSLFIWSTQTEKKVVNCMAWRFSTHYFSFLISTFSEHEKILFL